MDYSNIGLFTTLKAKIGYLSERQSVLAQNVANVDTPGYRAQDVVAPDFAKLAKSAGGASAQKLPLTLTDSKDIVPNMAGTGTYKIENRRTTYDNNPDGNNVSIEEEMMKVSQNQAEYTKSLNLYHKMVTLFNTAIGNSSSGS